MQILCYSENSIEKKVSVKHHSAFIFRKVKKTVCNFHDFFYINK